MIINPILINGFKRLKMDEPFFCCGYVEGTSQILLMNTEATPINPPNHVDGNIMLDGFASNIWEEFMQEVNNRGLILPVL